MLAAWGSGLSLSGAATLSLAPEPTTDPMAELSLKWEAGWAWVLWVETFENGLSVIEGGPAADGYRVLSGIDFRDIARSDWRDPGAGYSVVIFRGAPVPWEWSSLYFEGLLPDEKTAVKLLAESGGYMALPTYGKTIATLSADQERFMDWLHAYEETFRKEIRSPWPPPPVDPEAGGGMMMLMGEGGFSASDYDAGVPQTPEGVTFIKVVGDDASDSRWGIITNDTRWTANNVYVLDRPIFVRAPTTLVVEPGTIVRAEGPTATGASPTSPSDPGALIIGRGAKIIANGTAESPITFTSIDDDRVPGGASTIPPWENPLASSGSRDLSVPANRLDYQTADLGSENGFRHSGLWGGIAVLGAARVAQNNTNGTDLGADPAERDAGVGVDLLPGMEGCADSAYGGAEDGGNSGVLRFVSIRYAGARLWADLRMPALTLAACGTNTVVDFVEAWNAAGDGIAFRGGMAPTRHLASWYAGGDAFSWDEGYRGEGQHWFAIQDDATGSGRDPVLGAGDALIDGQGPEPDRMDPAAPYSVPSIWNATLIGRGADSANAAPRNGLRFRNNSGGWLHNAVVVETADGGLSIQAEAMQQERLTQARASGGPFNFSGDTDPAPGPDLVLSAVAFYANGAAGGGTADSVNVETNDAIVGPVLSAPDGTNTFAADPAPRAIARLGEDLLDPTLAAGSPCRDTNAVFDPPSPPLVAATYRGAFRDFNWLVGWSAATRFGVLTNGGGAAPPAVQIGFDGTDPYVEFPTEAGVLYSVESGADGRAYAPFAMVEGDGGTASVTNAGAGIGDVMFFRVMPQ